MSARAIWNLNAPRSELWGARKWQIYLFKATTGALLAFVLGFWTLFDLRATLVASATFFVTTKICWYLNTGDRPDRYSPLDWATDGALHFLWFAIWSAYRGDYGTAAGIASGLCGYPWSSE